MKAVLVRKEEAEAVRQRLFLEDAVDKERKLVKRNGFVEIPVRGYYVANDLTLVEQENPQFYFPKKTLDEILDIPECEKKLLPSGWQVLGDIIIVSLKEGLENRKTEIGRALLSIYPRCRTVLLDRGIAGQTRKPEREIILGEITETLHKENGCIFKLDAMRIMYSQGNQNEKRRMSKLGRGEIVLDMFAGIGYFSIPMAVHSAPKKIIALEINPVAFDYLKENVKLNKVEEIVEPVIGDCAVVCPIGIADRVIMGYLEANMYLEHGIRALLPGGILHYHEAVPEAIERRSVERVIEAAGKMHRKAEILGVRRIKKYSPGVWHVVVDAKLDAPDLSFQA